jgi:hypothetical protein
VAQVKERYLNNTEWVEPEGYTDEELDEMYLNWLEQQEEA